MGHGWSWDGSRQWRARRRPFFATPVFVAAIQIIGTRIAAREQPDAAALDAAGYGLLLAGPAALLVVRRWPLVTLGACLAAVVGYLAGDYPRGPFFVAAIVALFGAVQRANRIAVWTLCAMAYAVYVVTAEQTLGEYLVVAAWTAVAIAVAELSRVRMERYAEIARTRAEAARARQEQQRRQASDERLRIARELHDVLGHHLSLINVRAGVALHLLDSKPEQAREALGAIKVASAEALREVRGVLAALTPHQEGAPRSPAPGLADIDHLADEARAAGLRVTVRREGVPRPVPGEVDRAAYRIVQEALTNVRRHAGAEAAVTVLVGYDAGALTVRVEDTGTGPGSDVPATGNGIPGMRERASALGGTLTAGPGAGGGFQVNASLPIPATDPVTTISPVTTTDPVTEAEPFAATRREDTA